MMYEVDGIDLTRSQYAELRALASIADEDERKAFSDKALRPYGQDGMWNPNGVWLYRSLYEMGLIDGTPVSNGFVFYGVLTQAGTDWVDDFAAKELAEKKLLWSDRRFQLWLSLFTLVLSTALGWLAGGLH